MTWISGLDVSAYQATTPNLTGKDFLFVKASEGTTPDARYRQHVANARKAGVVVGAYHFGRSDVSIALQVAAFLKAAGDVDLYALDVEGSYRPSPVQIRVFIAGVQAAGKVCGVYASLSGFPTGVGADFNWVALYGSHGRPPSLFKPGAFWQDGPEHGVDHDYYNGTRAQLELLARGLPSSDTGAAVRTFTFDATAKDGTATVNGAGHSYLRLLDNTLHPIAAGDTKPGFGPVTLVGGGITGPADTRTKGYVIGNEAAFMIEADVTFTATSGTPAADIIHTVALMVDGIKKAEVTV